MSCVKIPSLGGVTWGAPCFKGLPPPVWLVGGEHRARTDIICCETLLYCHNKQLEAPTYPGETAAVVKVCQGNNSQ